MAPVTVGVLLLAAAEAWDRVTSDPTRTDVKYFRPYAHLGATDGLRIANRASGKCFINLSIANDAAGAYRCFAEDSTIYDPCWRAEWESVICVGDPWAEEATFLEVTRWQMLSNRRPHVRTWDANKATGPLDPRPSHTETPPWALELADGERCIYATGATFEVAGQRANYVCESGSAVIGEPDRRREIWFVALLPDGQRETRQVRVHEAWY